jgi:hypothetical protein
MFPTGFEINKTADDETDYISLFIANIETYGSSFSL